MFRLTLALVAVASAEAVCFAENNTWTVTYDPHASSTGYYKFEECGDDAMPTLAMRRGQEYVFVQDAASNWFHPLGFSYVPNAAHHMGLLNPMTTQSKAENCSETMSCQAPQYFLNGEFLGMQDDPMGLDAYKADFFLPRATWRARGAYEVRLALTDDFFESDFFYFCHVHNGMVGRVKVLDDDDVLLSAEDVPPLGFEYETPSAFDATCGTYGTSEYARGSGACDDTFLCLRGNETQEELEFADCFHALDCAMDYTMRTVFHDTSKLATFVHQMIPHHENAVNMAKLMLASEEAFDFDFEDDVAMYDMMWDVVNTQNYQISLMKDWLDARAFDHSALCSLCGDADWHLTGDLTKDCSWVALNVTDRCDLVGESGALAHDECRESCGLCYNPLTPLSVASSRRV